MQFIKIGDNRVVTYRNRLGYWVAKMDSGPFANLQSWAKKKSVAVADLERTVDDVLKSNVSDDNWQESSAA